MSQECKPTNYEKIYAFDSLYTTNHIQMLKILLPYLNPPLQKTLALYIKFLELCYTISFLQAHPFGIKGCGFDIPPTNWEIISDELFPYLSPSEANRLKQMKQAFQMMKQFESMQTMMDKLNGILPESMNFKDLFDKFQGSQGNPSFLSKEIPFSPQFFSEGMLTKEQQEVFNKFNQRFENLL